jgi:hypothetical protein
MADAGRASGGGGSSKKPAARSSSSAGRQLMTTEDSEMDSGLGAQFPYFTGTKVQILAADDDGRQPRWTAAYLLNLFASTKSTNTDASRHRRDTHGRVRRRA